MMLRRVLVCAAIVAMALAAVSCISTRYIGPTGHVPYQTADSKVKSSSQTSALKEGENPIVSTYDEEYTYDEKGNVLRVKLTEYIDRLDQEKKFIVWETESKLIGGNLVPWRVSANGVPFVEVEYDILTTPGKGVVTEDITDRNFVRVQGIPLAQPSYQTWGVTLSANSVSFAADGKFVREVRRYSVNEGTYLENVLTLGYDNIVLKHFHFSREKLSEGIAKSYTGYDYNSDMFRKLSKGVNVDYSYEWKTIADRICQARMTFESMTLKLDATEEYNAAGKRTKETWLVSNPQDAKTAPVKIFEQNLTY
jgi:hypothetical protein